jgi:hypothetical protein
VPVAIKKAGLPVGFNDPAIFSIADADMDLFETFSKGLKEKIQSSPEWQAREQYTKTETSGGQSMEDIDEDIPF